jgi:hypothetical protein
VTFRSLREALQHHVASRVTARVTAAAS